MTYQCDIFGAVCMFVWRHYWCSVGSRWEQEREGRVWGERCIPASTQSRGSDGGRQAGRDASKGYGVKYKWGQGAQTTLCQLLRYNTCVVFRVHCDFVVVGLWDPFWSCFISYFYCLIVLVQSQSLSRRTTPFAPRVQVMGPYEGHNVSLVFALWLLTGLFFLFPYFEMHSRGG